MVNSGRVARRYHDLTVHSPDSVRASGHTLDWDNKPFPFKVYTDLPGLHLTREIDVLATPTLAAIAGEGAPAPSALALPALTSLLYYVAGVTKRKTYPGGGEVLFRAAASTGALYQTEVYVVAGAVDDLPAGVYHFCPGDFTLRRLRTDDARGLLAEAAADAMPGRRAATLVLSRHEVEEPLVAQAHAASALATPDDVVRWRTGQAPPPPPGGARLVALPRPDPRDGRVLGETIQRRGSTRRFAQAPIGLAELGATLWAASRPVPGDLPTGLVDIYMSAHAVEGLAPGTYLYRRDAHALDPLDAGDFRHLAAFLFL